VASTQSHCPKCGAEIPADAKACPSCLAPLAETVSDRNEAGGRAARRVVFAGFWLRAVAYAIDLLLLGIFLGFAVLGPLMARGAIPADNPWFLTAIPFRQALAIQLLFWMALWAYFALFESSSWQATPGKKALGLVVTDLAGNRVSFARASGRNLAKHISEFVFMLGFAMAGITPRKQALHDILAKCLVLRKV